MKRQGLDGLPKPMPAFEKKDPTLEIKETLEKCRHNKEMFLKTMSQLNGAHESMRTLLVTPISKDCGVLEFEIVRNASGFNTFNPKYTLAMTTVQPNGTTLRQELIVAKKKFVNRTSNFILSMDVKNPKSKGTGYMGKLRSTTTKKDEYFLFGPGENPERVKNDQIARKTFMLCKFDDEDIQGLGKVKKTRCFLPYYYQELGGKMYPYDGVEDPHELGISKDVHALKNKKPRWSKSKKKYVFKFGSRVKEPSNKNTQLIENFRYDPAIAEEDEKEESSATQKEKIIFQFGKFDKVTFNLDVQAPFSIFQAFSLCVAI